MPMHANTDEKAAGSCESSSITVQSKAWLIKELLTGPETMTLLFFPSPLKLRFQDNKIKIGLSASKIALYVKPVDIAD